MHSWDYFPVSVCAHVCEVLHFIAVVFSKRSESYQEEIHAQYACILVHALFCACALSVQPPHPTPPAHAYSHTACAGSNCLRCLPTLPAFLFHRADVCPGPPEWTSPAQDGEKDTGRHRRVCDGGERGIGGLAMVPCP